MIRFLMLLLAVGASALAVDCPDDRAGWRDFSIRYTDYLERERYQPAALGVFTHDYEACAEEIETKDAACFANILRFAREGQYSLNPGHTLGTSLSDVDYYAKVPYPDMLEMPPELITQEFLRLMDLADAASIDAALKRIDAINAGLPADRKWLAFPYESQHLPTPDGSWTLGRFFVLVPGEKFDRYLQFGIRIDEKKRLPNGLSMVTVDKTASPKVARLKDFWRSREGGKVVMSTRLDEMGGLENCYDCHKNALLPITPKPSAFDEKRFGVAMREANRRMRAFGALELAGQDRGAYGPGLGPETSPVRTPEFIASCSAGRVQAARLDVFTKAMHCEKCHDGKSRGALNYPSADKKLPVGGTMIDWYVVNHAVMPKGVALEENERRALVDCLRDEYYKGFGQEPGQLKAWMLQRGCWNQ